LMHKICFTIRFISCLYMFRAHVLIIRRSKLHYTASGIITPIGGRTATYRCDVCHIPSDIAPVGAKYPSKAVILNHHSKALVYPEHGIQPLDLMTFACKGFLLRVIALRNIICPARPFRFARLIRTTVPEVVNAIRIPTLGYSDKAFPLSPVVTTYSFIFASACLLFVTFPKYLGHLKQSDPWDVGKSNVGRFIHNFFNGCKVLCEAMNKAFVDGEPRIMLHLSKGDLTS